jgi:hypothetical protein
VTGNTTHFRAGSGVSVLPTTRVARRRVKKICGSSRRSFPQCWDCGVDTDRIGNAEELRDVFNVNVRGLSSSIAGSIAFPGTSIYSAPKAAVISLGKTLAVELAPRGIQVNVLSPGPIDTPILNKTGLPPDQLKGFEETIVAKSRLKRMGTADEVARAARFLDSYFRRILAILPVLSSSSTVVSD